MESFALNFTGTMLALTVVIAVAWFALRLLRDRLQPGPKAGQGAGSAHTAMGAVLGSPCESRFTMTIRRDGIKLKAFTLPSA